MFDTPLGDLSEEYLMYLFAKEFGYTPAEFHALPLRTRQRLHGFLVGEADGVKHRRGDLR